MLLYYVSILVLYRPKSKHAPKPREGSTQAIKKVWHVDEQPLVTHQPPAEHHPFMGLGPDHAPLLTDHFKEEPDDLKPAISEQPVEGQAVNTILDQAEAYLDAIISSFDHNGDPQVLLAILREAISNNTPLSQPAYKGILNRLIVQKAFVMKKVKLGEEQVQHLWSE